MTPAIAYHRFSTSRQEHGTSLERQRNATAELAKRRGLTIVATLEDCGRSAWKGHHLSAGHLGRLRARIDAGEFASGTVILVENLDRLSRQEPRESRRWIEDVTDRGIVVAVNSPDLWLDKGAMNGENLAAFVIAELERGRANKESSRKSEFRPDVIKAQMEKARNGIAFTKRIPAYLAINDEKRVVAIEERAALVTAIYEWCASGLGYDSIAKRLNATVEPWNGKAWHIGYIRDLLSSPIPEGEYHPASGDERTATGEVITGYYPRIVEPELVNRARAAILKRRRSGGAKNVEAKNLFTGVLQCAECGNAMTRTVNISKGRSYPYLICRTARVGLCSNTTQYRYDHFEKGALREILHLALDASFFVKADETASLSALVARLRKDVELFEGEVRSALDLVLKVQSDALIARLTDTEAKLAKARADLAKAEDDLNLARGNVSPDEHMRRVLEIASAIDDDDTETREQARRMVREAMGSVVSRIIFDRTWATNLRAERDILLIMTGHHLAFRFDGQGKLVERIDYQAMPESADALQRETSRLMIREGMDDPEGAARIFADIRRRSGANSASAA